MNAAALLELQEVDSALDAIANRRPRLAELVAHHQARDAVAAHRREVAAITADRQQAQADIDAAEAAAHQIDVQRTRLEGQLKTVIAPREAEALMHEIDNLNARRGELDDQELAAIEAQEHADTRLRELAAGEATLLAELDRTAAELDGVSGALDAQVAQLAEQRVGALGVLGADERAAYDRGRTHFGGVAVARLDGKRCTGCHLDLSPAELDVVRAVAPGEPAECPQCSRLLVR